MYICGVYMKRKNDLSNNISHNCYVQYGALEALERKN